MKFTIILSLREEEKDELGKDFVKYVRSASFDRRDMANEIGMAVSNALNCLDYGDVTDDLVAALTHHLEWQSDAGGLSDEEKQLGEAVSAYYEAREKKRKKK